MYNKFFITIFLKAEGFGDILILIKLSGWNNWKGILIPFFYNEL